MYYTLPPSQRGFLISQGEAESIMVVYTTNTVLSVEGYPILVYVTIYICYYSL